MGEAPTRRFDGTTVIDNPVGYKMPVAGIPLSFEAGEQRAILIHVPFRARVTRVRSLVTKALAATDVGELTFTSPSGEFASLSHTASAPITQTRMTTVIDADNGVLEPGEDITITPEKTTVGGKVMVDLVLLRISGP